MVDIRMEAKSLFGEEESCRETFSSFECELKKSGELPSREEIDAFFALIPARDSMKIVFTDGLDRAELPLDTGLRPYKEFAAGVSSEDETSIRIRIDKSGPGGRDNVISIYCLETFLMFFTGEAEDTAVLMERWNEVVKRAEGRTAFEVLNTDAEFEAGAFLFTNDAAGFDLRAEERALRRQRAEEACTFMDRREMRLLPGDFTPETKLPEDDSSLIAKLAGTMRRLDTVLAVIYLGVSSRMEKDEAVVSITRGGRELHFPLKDIPENETLTKLIGWILSGEDAAERADVARSTVSLRCKDEAELLAAEASLTDAVRSAYSLYRSKNVERYLEVRKQLNKSILDSARQVAELIGSLIDSFKTNFIAIITVLITQVLAGNVDFAKLGREGFVKEDMNAVVVIYCGASFVYLAVTMLHIYFKWDFYCVYFERMKENFEGLLDGEELAAEFKKAGDIKVKAEKKLLLYSAVMAVLWIAILFVVWRAGYRA